MDAREKRHHHARDLKITFKVVGEGARQRENSEREKERNKMRKTWKEQERGQ